MRIEIIGGGEPSSDELAAITGALAAIEAEATATAAMSSRGLPGWVMAALREGVGGELEVAPPVHAAWS